VLRDWFLSLGAPALSEHDCISPPGKNFIKKPWELQLWEKQSSRFHYVAGEWEKGGAAMFSKKYIACADELFFACVIPSEPTLLQPRTQDDYFSVKLHAKLEKNPQPHKNLWVSSLALSAHNISRGTHFYAAARVYVGAGKN
jgi:hypothetical protein